MGEKIKSDRRKQITEIAYKALLDQSIYNYPIRNVFFYYPNVIVTSYEFYSQNTGAPVEKLNGRGLLEDGYTVKKLRNTYFIFYEEKSYSPRKTFTIMHELGHILLGHEKRGQVEEDEGHYFSSQILSPDCILEVIRDNGYLITETLISSAFGLSNSAALIKAESFFGERVHTQYDREICRRFCKFTGRSFPMRINRAALDIQRDF